MWLGRRCGRARLWVVLLHGTAVCHVHHGARPRQSGYERLIGARRTPLRYLGAVTRSTLAPPQLLWLLHVSHLDNVEIGIVPFHARLQKARFHSFVTYDDKLVEAGLYTDVVHVQGPGDIAHYVEVFDSFDDVAVFGLEADALIRGTRAAVRREVIISGRLAVAGRPPLSLDEDCRIILSSGWVGYIYSMFVRFEGAH